MPEVRFAKRLPTAVVSQPREARYKHPLFLNEFFYHCVRLKQFKIITEYIGVLRGNMGSNLKDVKI
jgi:hypothetical protein